MVLFAIMEWFATVLHPDFIQAQNCLPEVVLNSYVSVTKMGSKIITFCSLKLKLKTTLELLCIKNLRN